jgi:phosphoglycolate phosphatase
LGVSLAYEHVVFDLDGTLIDSRVDLTNAVNHALRTLGLPEQPLPVISGYIGEGVRTLVQRALGPASGHQLEEALNAFMSFYGAHLLDHTVLYPGIAEALSALAERTVVMSVLTNKPESMSRAILNGFGILNRFVAVLGGDSLPARKPDPAGLEHLRALTATPPDRMLVVGDSAIDMQAARAAGFAFCGVAWGLNPERLMAAQPERMIARPSELVALVEGGGTGAAA